MLRLAEVSQRKWVLLRVQKNGVGGSSRSGDFRGTPAPKPAAMNVATWARVSPELKRDTGCGAEDWVVFWPTGEHFLWWDRNLGRVKASKSERLGYFPQHQQPPSPYLGYSPCPHHCPVNTSPGSPCHLHTQPGAALSLLRALYGSFIPQTSLLPFYRMS